jgi:hypothetical protein
LKGFKQPVEVLKMSAGSSLFTKSTRIHNIDNDGKDGDVYLDRSPKDDTATLGTENGVNTAHVSNSKGQASTRRSSDHKVPMAAAVDEPDLVCEDEHCMVPIHPVTGEFGIDEKKGGFIFDSIRVHFSVKVFIWEVMVHLLWPWLNWYAPLPHSHQFDLTNPVVSAFES